MLDEQLASCRLCWLIVHHLVSAFRRGAAAGVRM
jgi:hypothetical protein